MPEMILYFRRLSQYWEDPDTFKPERFAGDSNRNPYTFLPFIAGPRTCIGSKFALAEMRAVTAVLVRHFQFDPVPGVQYKNKQRITMRPEPPLCLRVSKALLWFRFLLFLTKYHVWPCCKSYKTASKISNCKVMIKEEDGKEQKLSTIYHIVKQLLCYCVSVNCSTFLISVSYLINEDNFLKQNFFYLHTRISFLVPRGCLSYNEISMS